MKIKNQILFLMLILPILTLGQSISPSTFNSIGASFKSSNAGLDINIGESITGPISNNNSIVTQGLLQPNNFTLNLKLYLEGFYSGNGLMNNGGMGGCLYKVGVSTNSNDVDTIRLTLVDKISLESVETAKAILQTDGSANFYFHGATEGFYYLKLNHRNTIETWSASPVLLTNEGTYDFTAFQNKAYGNNMTETFDQMGWAFYSGDVADALQNVGHQDGIIGMEDYLSMENAVFNTYVGYLTEDITGDGVSESLDYMLMENNKFYLILSTSP